MRMIYRYNYNIFFFFFTTELQDQSIRREIIITQVAIRNSKNINIDIFYSDDCCGDLQGEDGELSGATRRWRSVKGVVRVVVAVSSLLESLEMDQPNSCLPALLYPIVH